VSSAPDPNLVVVTEALNRLGLAIHPAANNFPMETDEELTALAEDIAAHGLRHPPLFWKRDGQRFLIDGRNRVAAICRLDGALERLRDHLVEETELNTFDEASTSLDPVGLVLSLNVHRRHLTADKKREIAAALLKADPTKSDRRVAAESGLNRTDVGVTRKKLEQAGDVSFSDTRPDTKGRQQPATKPAPSKLAPRERDNEPAPLPPIVPERERPAPGADDPGQPAAPPPTRDRFRDTDELVQLLTVLRGDRSRIDQVPQAKRLALARGCLEILNVKVGDLIVGGQP
jgi:hypothetical protein